MSYVSVIVPVYNCEEYLSKCIDSVLKQTWADFELLLVNDGSTDDSGQICRQYERKDSRVRVIDKENGGGAGEARNVGVSNSKSKFIVFLDSDDYMEKIMLETLIRVQTEGDYDVVICGFVEYVYGESDQFSQYIAYENKKLNDFNSVRNFFAEHYPEGMLGFPWNKLYKRNIIQDNHIFFPKMRRLEDGIFNTQYFGKCSSCCIIDTCLYFHKNSEQVELRKLPYDFYDLMEIFVLQYYETLKEWKFNYLLYEKKIVDYFQNDFVCCLENIFESAWEKTFKERIAYISELREKKLVRYMITKPYVSRKYTELMWNAFVNRQYHLVYLLSQIKRILKTKAKMIFYLLRKELYK